MYLLFWKFPCAILIGVYKFNRINLFTTAGCKNLLFQTDLTTVYGSPSYVKKLFISQSSKNVIPASKFAAFGQLAGKRTLHFQPVFPVMLSFT